MAKLIFRLENFRVYSLIETLRCLIQVSTFAKFKLNIVKVGILKIKLLLLMLITLTQL